MRIYNTALKLARFIYILLRKNVLNSRQFQEYFGILAAARSYRALQKNSTAISQEKITGYYREFWNFGGSEKLQGITKKFHRYISGKNYWLLPAGCRQNEQTKKSVPFFYSQRSRESQKYGFIEFLSLRYKSEKLTFRISIF